MGFEELLQDGQRVGLAKPVETETSPGLRSTFRDEGAALAVEAVCVTPQPPGGRPNEPEREGAEDLARAKPDVLVPPHPDVGPQAVCVQLSYSAVDAAARNDKIGVDGLGGLRGVLRRIRTEPIRRELERARPGDRVVADGRFHSRDLRGEPAPYPR